jgi:hypothetical protein
MPTEIQERGFRVMIYLNDHKPPHVHVWKAGHEARVLLDPVELWDSDLPPSENRQAVAIVEANRDTLLARWQEIHGDDDGITSE